VIGLIRLVLELSGLAVWLVLAYVALTENFAWWRTLLRQRLHTHRVNKATYQATVLLDAMARARDLERRRR
jgi:hypothetical protein